MSEKHLPGMEPSHPSPVRITKRRCRLSYDGPAHQEYQHADYDGNQRWYCPVCNRGGINAKLKLLDTASSV